MQWFKNFIFGFSLFIFKPKMFFNPIKSRTTRIKTNARPN